MKSAFPESELEPCVNAWGTLVSRKASDSIADYHEVCGLQKMAI